MGSEIRLPASRTRAENRAHVLGWANPIHHLTNGSFTSNSKRRENQETPRGGPREIKGSEGGAHSCESLLPHRGDFVDAYSGDSIGDREE